MAVDFEELRRAMLSFPGMVEGTSYSTPAFRLGKRFIARLREPDILALTMEQDERDMMIEARPGIFFVTDHYRGYPFVLVRLAAIEPEHLHTLIERVWRSHAPPRLRKAKKSG